MTKRKNKINILILFVIILGVTMGYAILSTNLNIIGSSTINNPSWNIYFANLAVRNGSVSGSQVTTAAAIDNAKTTVSYAVTLKEPGEYYEFEVDAVNAGTINGMVSVVSNKLNGTEITTLPNYLDYSVTYIDGIPIEANHSLAAGTSARYRVIVIFRPDVDPIDLPATDQTLNLSFSVTYVQADNNSTAKARYLYHYGRSKIGDTVSGNMINSTQAYNDYRDITGTNYFIRNKVENNIVTETYLGYEYKNHVIYLRASGASYDDSQGWNVYNNDSPYYEKNKNILLKLFGIDNCYDYNNNTFEEDIFCSNHLGWFHVLADGRVEYEERPYYGCLIDSEGSTFCGYFGG